jgi:hypothetical protein
MKRLLPLLVVALSGCSAVDAYLMGHFDSTEYQMISQIRYTAQASQNDCSDAVLSKANANDIARQTALYAMYEGDLPHNDDSIRASKSLDTIAQELKTRYNSSATVSAMYCKLKFSAIENSASLIQHVQGNRPR